MASAIAHALVGAGIGLLHHAWIDVRSGDADVARREAAGGPADAGTLRRWVLPLAGAVLAVLPDADVVMHRWVEYSHAFGHRGAFHSPAFYLVLGLGLALALRRRRAVAFSCFFTALLSHSLLDMLTDGGLGVAMLWPASEARMFFPWRPIPVSPLSVRAFLGEWGLRVLRVELPLALPFLGVAALSAWLARRRLRSG